jgi:hypothetical protein
VRERGVAAKRMRKKAKIVVDKKKSVQYYLYYSK